MNSLVNSLRVAVRARPAPVHSICRAFSTPSTSTATASESSPSSASPSSSSPAAELDSLLSTIQTAKAPSPRPNPRNAASVAEAYAHKGPAHAAMASIYSSPSAPRSFSPGSTVRAATPDELWRRQMSVQYSLPVTTTSSRSFAVQNRNVAQAYRNLNRVMQENNIRRELKRQERFESPSNKRVRLNSERHRRRFKVAVGKAVALAMRMKDL
ncbi:hypothetical protein JCM10213_004455 [Rhodosporidiobolus nylandii]